MNDLITRYLIDIEMLLIKTPFIYDYEIIRADNFETEGKFRIKTKTNNQDTIDLFEYFTVTNNIIVIQKYHYHWQDSSNNLICRWDNAPHHKSLPNFPHHVHFPEHVESLKTEISIVNFLEYVNKNFKN